MYHIDIKEIFDNTAFIGGEVIVCGWVRSSRESKNVAFLALNDGTIFKSIQIVIDKKGGKALPEEAAKLGACVRVKGKAVKNEKNGDVEINAEEIELLGKCASDYPLQKKYQKLETLRENPHIRVRTNTFNAVFRARSVLAAATHKYFQTRGYVYINTPLITGSDCEGAGEMFKVTSIGYTDAYKSAEEYYENDFFGKKAGLSVSGQLEGEAAAMAFGKIYTFGPSFRAEKSNTLRHAAEFWHIEPEIAFAELDDIIKIAEDMLKHIIGDYIEKCSDELEFFERRFEDGLRNKLLSVVNGSFEVVDYTAALEQLKKADVSFNFPVFWGCDLQSEAEKYITETLYKKPVFLVNYPKEIKSFYMKQNPDGKTVAATDLLVPGIGEIIGGSEREADYEKLVAAMMEKKMNMSDYNDYLDLRRFGTAPHSGFGLGFERLIMYCTGMSNIRDVIFYPRTVGSIR